MSRAAQREATRSLLVEHALELFAEHGYGAVSIPDVVRAAGLTKGAVYHQFDGKADLFAAVLTHVQQGVGEAVATAADAESSGWDGLIAGCRAFLQASTAADVRRIMLVDGPAVLGWDRWRALDDAASGRHLVEALDALMASGELTARPVEPLARLLSGAMNEAALWLARPDAAPADLEHAVEALTAMLEGLRPRA